MSRRSWTPLKLEGLMAGCFDPLTRSRGLTYHRQGRVELANWGPGAVEAVVRGSSRYRTSLVYNRGLLVASCTCPWFHQGFFCKHLWATVLAAEGAGSLGEALDDPDVAVVHGDELGAGEQEFLDEGPLDDPPAFVAAPWPSRTGELQPFGRPLKGPGTPPPIPAAPPWQQVLTAIERFSPVAPAPGSAPSWPAGQELLYVLDASSVNPTGGRPLLHLLTHRPKKAGGWTKLQLFRPHGVNPDRAPPDPVDRQVLAMLIGGSPYEAYYGSTCYSLSDGLMELLLPLLGQTGRLRVRRLADGSLMEGTLPETVEELGILCGCDAGAPWELRLRLVAADDGQGYLLQGHLARNGQTMALDEPLLLLSGGWVFARSLAARLHAPGIFGWISALRRQPELRVPKEDGPRFVQHLLTQEQQPPVELPPELCYQERRVPPQPRLEVRQHSNPWYRDRLSAHVWFLYDQLTVPAEPPSRGTYDPERGEFLLRDPAAELAARSRLPALGFRRDPCVSPADGGLMLPAGRLPEVLAPLLAEGWRVEAEGKVYRRGGAFTLKVRSGIDWFEAEGGLEFDGTRVALPALLAAARRGDSLVVLDDGSLGVLPTDWLQQWGLLAAGQPEGDRLRFRRGQAALLDALAAARPEVSGDELFRQAREELARFVAVEPAEPPGTFCGRLRGYQREGLGWLHFLRRFGLGGCLADDMGLGKTVQVLALLESRRLEQADGRSARGQGGTPPAKPSLVVVPRSLLFNWQQEAARFTPELRVLEHSGLGRRREGGALADWDLVLTTYGTLRRDVGFLQEVVFDYVILDEAQAIKNAGTAAAKAARRLQTEHRLALSGTPIENHLGELWSLIEFLNPGLLGASAVGSSPGRRGGDLVQMDRAVLSRALRPVILRRTKAQVARDLPGRTEQTLYCELEGQQRKEYDRLRDYYRAAVLGRVDRLGIGKARFQVLEALLRLRQAACHLGLIDRDRAGQSSAKLETLLPQLAEVTAEGHKALVFSQFTRFLDLVRARLDEAGIAYAYLDGRTRDRAQRVERFQTDPDCLLFLISLKAGGLGLNLTAAEYVFLLDPWWNPAVEAQAIDRTHRIGQTQPVFAYRLIARDTVEEKVVALQQTKRELADAILGENQSLLRTLTRQDLEVLLG